MTHITCRLTAKNRDQLRNPTLGNRVWATFLDVHAGVLYSEVVYNVARHQFPVGAAYRLLC